ncbi:sperm mitochondrial-associated cysteine-rich protein-like isoform X2 [Diprion similis]|uniref:sperm mitochondrial-associated cysteine-rich protein-like isoform X2 n=1 Tax=Diprion similis TaxID=362088 RepID=UPI001EF87900|nr:sperm mitochondrial-associated cysteine-rich protein-like isoform X2 [Diprion similis]
MADTTKSLWSRIMEGGSDNLLNIGGEKRTCPYDRKSCTTNLIDGNTKHESNKSSPAQCHPGCPEPKRPLQPEEFCPNIGKPKPPECCFIRMQDPCAPCCCPPPPQCEDECHRGPKRDPICGCDLCKKKQCPDGKCCGPKEPSCHKGVKDPTNLEKA